MKTSVLLNNFEITFPKTCDKATLKSLSSTFCVKNVIVPSANEVQFCNRGLFSICLVCYTATCNSNLFVWFCSCEEDQTLRPDEGSDETPSPQQVIDGQDVNKLTNQESSASLRNYFFLLPISLTSLSRPPGPPLFFPSPHLVSNLVLLFLSPFSACLSVSIPWRWGHEVCRCAS